MYQLESAKVKPVNRNGYWLDEDLSTKTIGEIFQDYKKVIFYLSNNYFPDRILYLEMEKIKNLPFLNTEITLPDWFIEIGNLALPTEDEDYIPDLSPRIVKYGDAWKANYTMTKVPDLLNITVPVIDSMKVDLLLTREETDYELMNRRVLASVNGFMHFTSFDDDGYRIRQGGKSATFCNKTQIGLLSFNEVGNISLLPISREMIKQPQIVVDNESFDAIPLKEKVYINTGVDLTNKSIMISIGGYLHNLNDNVSIGIVPANPDPVEVSIFNGNYWIAGLTIEIDPERPIMVGQTVHGIGIKPYTTVMEVVKSGNIITSIRLNNSPTMTTLTELSFFNDVAQRSVVDVVGQSTIVINWHKINFAHRYFEQRRFMDMSSLGLSTNVNNPSQVDVEEFYSNETIKRYLEMSQSFIIIIEDETTPDLFCEYNILESSKLPGVYYTHEEPMFPMQIGLGRLGNYWKTYDDGKWVLSVEDSFYHYYGFETTQYLIEQVIDDSKVPNKPIDFADAYLMFMGID